MKMLKVFWKDVKIAKRDMLILYILIIPLLLAVLIRLLAPGLADSVTRVAMVKTEDPAAICYLQSMAEVELVEDRAALEKRVLKRDDVPGLIKNGSHFDIITEGNEPERAIEGVKQLAALYELGSTPDKTTAQLFDFEKQVPQVRTMLTNILIQLIIMLGGMIISLGMVEEKCDNTVSAARVTPLRLWQFAAGKCMLGCLAVFVSIALCLVILQYTGINWGQLLLVCLSTTVLAAFAGLAQGVISSDIIEAAAGVKLMMVPMLAAILVRELCSERWQWTMYWNPFYWSYRGSIGVLSGVATWGEAVMCSALVLVLSAVVCRMMWPVIDKGLRRV